MSELQSQQDGGRIARPACGFTKWTCALRDYDDRKRAAAEKAAEWHRPMVTISAQSASKAYVTLQHAVKQQSGYAKSAPSELTRNVIEDMVADMQQAMDEIDAALNGLYDGNGGAGA